MATVLDCAKLARAAYGEVPAGGGWASLGENHMAGGGLHGSFQGMAFSQGNTVVFAFKGTAVNARTGPGDLLADLKLGVGMNTVQFDQANSYVAHTMSQVPTGAQVFVCGHSLGGAIAQIVGNRRRLPFVTFNAPGVGVLAGNFRELATQSPVMQVARLAGSVLSVARHPVQASQDAGSLFYQVQGTNVRLSSDPVSAIGVHYGRVATMAYTGLDAHFIDTMIGVLESNPMAGINIEGFTRR